MVNVKFIRGLPGSGKSTYAKNNFSDYVHCEADDYFYTDVGDDIDIYNFDPNKLYLAHRACLEKFCEAINNGKDVVVSNTFIKANEFSKYKRFLKDCGIEYNVEIISLDKNYGSIHNVPQDVIKRMKQNMITNEEAGLYFDN